VAVDAEVNKEQGRPLFGVDGEVCSKKYLTGPTLLEMRRMPGNDFMGSAMRIGATWTNIIGVVSAGFAFYVVWQVMVSYKGFPEMPVQP